MRAIDAGLPHLNPNQPGSSAAIAAVPSIAERTLTAAGFSLCQWQPKTTHFRQLKTAHFLERRRWRQI